jgi:hypothetical protein
MLIGRSNADHWSSGVQISIGFSTPKVTARRMPGWEPDSYGYGADDGCLLLGNSNNPKKYGPPYGNGDVIGCGINFHKNHIFFTKNGNHLGRHGSKSRREGRVVLANSGIRRSGNHEYQARPTIPSGRLEAGGRPCSRQLRPVAIRF